MGQVTRIATCRSAQRLAETEWKGLPFCVDALQLTVCVLLGDDNGMDLTADLEKTLMNRVQHRSWSFWLGILVSLTILVWAVGALDWVAVTNALGNANPMWIVLGVVTVLVTIATRLARWIVLLGQRRVRANSLLSAMLVGQLLNYFAPARAGDLARAYLVGYSESESAAWALGTVALEKMWDLWTLLSLVAVLSLSMAVPDWLLAPSQGMAVLAVLALALFGLTLRYRNMGTTVGARLGRHLPTNLNDRLQSSAHRLLDGLDGLRRPRVWVWAAFWSAATWGIGSLTNHTVLMAMGLSLPFTAAVMLMVVLQLGVAVPSLPGRVGLYEGLVIVVLALFDVDRDTAFATGLVLHAVSFVPPILLGLYYAWRIRAIRRLRVRE